MGYGDLCNWCTLTLLHKNNKSIKRQQMLLVNIGPLCGSECFLFYLYNTGGVVPLRSSRMFAPDNIHSLKRLCVHICEKFIP